MVFYLDAKRVVYKTSRAALFRWGWCYPILCSKTISGPRNRKFKQRTSDKRGVGQLLYSLIIYVCGTANHFGPDRESQSVNRYRLVFLYQFQELVLSKWDHWSFVTKLINQLNLTFQSCSNTKSILPHYRRIYSRLYRVPIWFHSDHLKVIKVVATDWKKNSPPIPD